MRAVAQFTITSICDVVASESAPENPYMGQLWVNTNESPPETMVWNGSAWVVQNNLEPLRTTVSTITTKNTEFQQSVDGLNSYVSSLTETVETISGGLEEGEQRVTAAEQQISQLQQSVNGLSLTVQNKYVGGIAGNLTEGIEAETLTVTAENGIGGGTYTFCRRADDNVH